MSAEQDKQEPRQAAKQNMLLRSDDAIQSLRTMLAMAERGDILGVVIVGQKRDHSHVSVYSGSLNVPPLVGEMSVVQASLTQMELAQRHQNVARQVGSLRRRR